MATRRRSRPAAASRIIAAGVAVGTAGGAMAFMAANDPNVIVRTVTLPALPAPPAKVIVLDLHHQPAPTSAPVAGPPPSGPTNGRLASTTNRSAPVGASTSGAPAPAASTPAPAAPVAAPAPATKTGPS